MKHSILTDEGEFAYPETIDFNIPGKDGEIVPQEIVINYDDNLLTYRQLVCWCLFQRAWYYVIGSPKIGDAVYDAVEKMVANMEAESSACTNPYSPTKRVGSSRIEDYPPLIRNCFQWKETQRQARYAAQIST